MVWIEIKDKKDQRRKIGNYCSPSGGNQKVARNIDADGKASCWQGDVVRRAGMVHEAQGSPTCWIALIP